MILVVIVVWVAAIIFFANVIKNEREKRKEKLKEEIKEEIKEEFMKEKEDAE